MSMLSFEARGIPALCNSDWRKAAAEGLEHRDVDEPQTIVWNEILSTVQEIASRHPGIVLTTADRSLSLQPPGPGFAIDVELTGTGSVFTSFGAWFEEFDRQEVVFDLIEKALAGRIRTRYERVRGRLRKCSIELLARGCGWTTIGETSFWLWPSFRHPEVSYRSFPPPAG